MPDPCPALATRYTLHSVFEDMKPNIVVLGDSNTWAFGPAFHRHFVAEGWPQDQVVLHYRNGSSPQHWLPRGHRRYSSGKGELWRRRARQQPSVADAISPSTALVIIGLGGNMGTSSRDEQTPGALIDEIVRRAPNARLLWRGPPPATASRGRKVASVARKAGRHAKNALLKHVLGELGFAVLRSARPKAADRLYVDVLDMHAGGPAPGEELGVGRDVDHAYERRVLDSLQGRPWGSAEHVPQGPWSSFVRARDSLDSHVPRDTVEDFVTLLSGFGVLRASSRNPKPQQATVVDANALVRSGPPRFSSGSRGKIPRGTVVKLPRWEGRFAFVTEQDGTEIGWTARSNLVVRKSGRVS